ncbi:MAG: hypothetical protein IJV24_06815 [Prevotella sp.]|nr:hypothetical protein [Prevotella sp.]
MKTPAALPHRHVLLTTILLFVTFACRLSAAEQTDGISSSQRSTLNATTCRAAP